MDNERDDWLAHVSDDQIYAALTELLCREIEAVQRVRGSARVRVARVADGEDWRSVDWARWRDVDVAGR